jgi:hypothetical protein
LSPVRFCEQRCVGFIGSGYAHDDRCGRERDVDVFAEACECFIGGDKGFLGKYGAAVEVFAVNRYHGSVVYANLCAYNLKYWFDYLIADEQEQDGNQRFRSLITLHIRITLLSDVFATSGYAHGRAAIGNLQTLMGNQSEDVVPDLGTLHRACIWENILLKAGLTLKGIDTLASAEGSPLERSPSRGASAPLENYPAAGMVTTNGVPPEPEPDSFSAPADGGRFPSITWHRSEALKLEGPREQNAKALKHLTQGLPTALAPFFQGKATLHLSFGDQWSNADVYPKPLSSYFTRGAIRILPKESR